MKVHFSYARDAAEFHPSVLKQALDLKRELDSILGFSDLKNLTYEQREQLSKIRFKDDNLPQ